MLAHAVQLWVIIYFDGLLEAWKMARKSVSEQPSDADKDL